MTDEVQGGAAAAPETAAVEPTPSTEQAATEAVNNGEKQAENTEAAANSEAETGDDSAAGGKPKHKGGFQKRIDELTNDKKALARERLEADLRAQQYQRELETMRKQTPADPLDSDPGSEPKLENFKDIEDFLKAHRDYAQKVGFQQAKQAAEKAANEAKQRKEFEEQAVVRRNIELREYAAQQKYGDYLQSVSPYAQAVTSHPSLRQYLVESDHAPDVFYALSKDPSQLAAILQMSPFAAGRELLKLEAKLTAPPPPKPVTAAPAPIKPVGSSEKAPFSYETASMDEYARKRKEERRKAKG